MTRKTKTTKKAADAAPLTEYQREFNRAIADISNAYACLLNTKLDFEAALTALLNGFETIDALTDDSSALPNFCKASSELRLSFSRVCRLARMAEWRHADAERAIKEQGEVE